MPFPFLPPPIYGPFSFDPANIPVPVTVADVTAKLNADPALFLESFQKLI